VLFYCPIEVRGMKIRDHLSEEQKKKLNYKPKKKQKSMKEEKVDWADIMGTNRQTLRRGKGGAMKRR
jgi:Fe-S cluster assembly ATPase SufC